MIEVAAEGLEFVLEAADEQGQDYDELNDFVGLQVEAVSQTFKVVNVIGKN